MKKASAGKDIRIGDPGLSGNSSGGNSEIPWPRSRRLWVSAAVVFHLVCVALAPMAVVEPRSDLAMTLHRAVSPWTQATFTDHGYRFFAPEPGPSHLIEYEVLRSDGTVQKGVIPDPEVAWPRLMYHRWFMLSETVFQHVSMTLEPAQYALWKQETEQEIQRLENEGDAREVQRLRTDYEIAQREHERNRKILEQLVKQVERDLLARYEGVAVKTRMITRMIPSLYDIQRGRKLDDPRYLPEDATLPLGNWTKPPDDAESIAPRENPGPVSPGAGENR